MSDELNGRPTTNFWIIGGAALVWNLIGILFYVSEVTATPDAMAEGFSQAQIDFLTGKPVWATAAPPMIQEEYSSFSDYIWGFVDGRAIQNRFKKDSDVPATSAESDALSKDLKKRGFKFVGSTIMYAHMQATGLVNDHVVACFRHKACAR